MANYVGKDVSIKLKRDLGIFQGKIVKPEVDSITINNVFHNGVKLKKFEAHVTIAREEIETITFIQVVDPVEVASRSVQNTPVTQNTSPKESEPQKPTKSPPSFTNKKPNQYDGNKQQHKTTRPIPIRSRNTPNYISSSAPHSKALESQQNGKRNGNGNLNGNGNGNGNKRHRNYDLMQPDDFSDQGDFDFESNNAMFDKKSIFQEIEAETNPDKPDLVRQIGKAEEKYRHDQNILDPMFMQFKNIQLEFKPKQEYTTDEPGLLIPSIPQSLRNRIQNLAASHGYSMERQIDFLARGATELAIQLLGGSRRFSPKNLHQWPRVTIICDEPYNMVKSEMGLCTARQLACHGVNVMVFVKTATTNPKESKELELYTATGNDFTGNVKDLTPCDLIILSVSNMNQNSQIVRYIQQNRVMVMAIDPPVMGVNPGEINIRNTVIPILPLDDIHTSCGKLHLVNLGISNKFFKDAGIKYFPIFGSRSLIPLHLNA
jgi:enhancer of mRNA-decapping protein 3